MRVSLLFLAFAKAFAGSEHPSDRSVPIKAADVSNTLHSGATRRLQEEDITITQDDILDHYSFIGSNGCAYANDGVCDEPEHCTEGTDCFDCDNRHHTCSRTASPTALPTSVPTYIDVADTSFGILAPYHDASELHGRAIRVDLTNFNSKTYNSELVIQSVKVVDFSPPELDALCRNAETNDFMHDARPDCGMVDYAGAFSDVNASSHILFRKGRLETFVTQRSLASVSRNLIQTSLLTWQLLTLS